MTPWMTRQETAEYLQISTRHLDRLGLPRTMLGRMVRYSREAIDRHMAGLSWTPPATRTKGGPRPPLQIVVPGDDPIKRLKAKLRRQRRQ